MKREHFREFVIEDFRDVAGKLKFEFNLEFTEGEVTHIKWYHEDKWIRRGGSQELKSG